MAIRLSAVPFLPQNARTYVERFFREQEVLGIPCMVAQRHTNHPNGSSYARWGNGTAPSHSVDLMEFGKDEEGREVGEVLRDRMKKSPQDFIELCVDQYRGSTISD